MTDRPGAIRSRSARARRAGIYLLYGLLGAACLYVLVRNLDSPNDYENFLPFGQAALAGQMPYDPAVERAWLAKEGWATWPPAFAPVAALLARLDALLGQAATIFLWQAANLAALGYALAVVVRWVHGRRLSLGPGAGRASRFPDGGAAGPRGGAKPVPGAGASGPLPLHALPVLIGILVPARLLLSNFEHTQSNLLILGLAVAAFELFRRRRPWSGGLALGLSSAFKATSLLALPYLAWRGRWRDLGAAAGGCFVTWMALPALLLGAGEAGRWYSGWWVHTGELSLPTGSMNQSLQATLTRLVAPGGPVVPEGPGAGLLGGHGAEPWVLAAALGLGLAAAAAFGRPLRRVSMRREALELGVVFTAMGLLSPIGWKWHFVGLMPLAVALFGVTGAAGGGRRRAGPVTGPAGSRSPADAPGTPPGRAGDRLVYGALLAAALAINLTATGLVGGAAADWFELRGVVTWAALAMTAAALWRLGRERRSGAISYPGPGSAAAEGSA